MSVYDMNSSVNVEKISEAVFEDEKARGCLMGMGETSENVAEKYGISRQKQDQMAVDSHQKAFKAQQSGLFDSKLWLIQAKSLQWRLRSRIRMAKRNKLLSARMTASVRRPLLKVLPSLSPLSARMEALLLETALKFLTVQLQLFWLAAQPPKSLAFPSSLVLCTMLSRDALLKSWVLVPLWQFPSCWPRLARRWAISMFGKSMRLLPVRLPTVSKSWELITPSWTLREELLLSDILSAALVPDKSPPSFPNFKEQRESWELYRCALELEWELLLLSRDSDWNQID